jgi:uncharacterized membrane protein (DUF485 family)
MPIQMEGVATPERVEATDWEAIERSPEFRELVARRRSFVVPATVFFLGWYVGFVLLCGYAPRFMGRSVYEGLTVGYTLALSQFVMVWALTWAYLRVADRVFDPLRSRVRELATRSAPSGRFARTTETERVREEAVR